ncbi:MAG: PAS domain-containing protein [Chitinivibrionales bacterium]|nr:PAS domain-containing protein [Chitinivibrionales bacterium]
MRSLDSDVHTLLTEGLWEWNIGTGSIEYDEVCSHLFCETQRFSQFELFASHIHPDDQERFMQSLQKLLDGQCRVWQEHYRYYIGQKTWLSVISKGIIVERNSAGKPLRMVGTLVSDTTAENGGMQADGEGVLARHICDSSHMIIMAFGVDCRMRYCNEYTLEITGQKADAIKGADWFDLFIPSGEQASMHAVIDSLLTTGERRSATVALTTKEGYLIVSEMHFEIIKEGGADDKDVIVGIGRHTIDQQRSVVSQTGSIAGEQIKLFATTIAHEFNNILGGMLGYLDMVREFTLEDTQVQEYIRKALIIFKRANYQTRQLSMFAQESKLERQHFELDQLLTEAATFVFSGSNVAYSVKICNDLKPVNGDREQISHLLSNIFLNAKQAMPGGGSVAVDVSVASRGESASSQQSGSGVSFVKICVSDTGCGIEEKNMLHIFKPFYTTKKNHTGIGLTLCEAIITRHGGHITVESKPLQGTAITLWLPYEGMRL